MIAGLAQIDGADEGALAPGQVPVSWAAHRMIGTATLEGRFADVGHSESLAYRQTEMAARLIHYGIRELDGSVIHEAQREFTQEVSLHVFSWADADASAPPLAGIAYQSRLGNEFTNWAIFERPDQDPVRDASSTEIALSDSDLVATLELFGLELAHGH